MRTRPDIDIAELFRVHEFSVVPRALSDYYGLPLKCSDKFGFLHGLKELLKKEPTIYTSALPAEQPIAIIDAMGMVNQLKIAPFTKTVWDLAKQFCDRVKGLLTLIKPRIIMLAFDSYSESEANIKAKTWDARNCNPVRYHLKEQTELKGLTMKDILSHPVNKRILTEIFSDFFTQSMGHNLFVVAHEFVVKSNVLGWYQDQHSHFEPDTLLICMLNEALRLRHEASSVLSDCYFRMTQ